MFQRKKMSICLGVAMASALLMGLAHAEGAPAESEQSALNYHNAFLMNLHHFLLKSAMRPETLDKTAWAQQPDAEEMARLQEALNFYRHTFSERGYPFTDIAITADELLQVADERRDAKGLGLAPELEQQLERVRPMYERCLWSVHRAHNTAWLDALKPLLREHGSAIERSLTLKLAHSFPAKGIRVDIVDDTATFEGAFTTSEPAQTIYPSTRRGYTGRAALEMVYHEAAHAEVDATLAERLKAEMAGQHKTYNYGLQHALHFYTVGEIVRVRYAQAASSQNLPKESYEPYVQYGEAQGVFKRAWPQYLPLLREHWQAYLDGRTDMTSALRAIVSSLPAETSNAAR